jgi:maltodextrin utilization protein YvdJ
MPHAAMAMHDVAVAANNRSYRRSTSMILMALYVLISMMVLVSAAPKPANPG